MGTADDKAALRTVFRAERAAVAPADRRRWSEALTAHVMRSPGFVAAKRVAGFVGFGGEPDTLPLLRRVLELGKLLVLPRIVRPRLLAWHEVDALDELVPHAFGLLEPPAAAPTSKLEPCDLVLVPGLAFSSDGTRLGFGAGYYDRAFEHTGTRPFRLGACFSASYDARPLVRESFDVPVHAVVTELGITACSV